MLRLIVVAFAALCLFGTSSLALAEDAMKGEMGNMKDEMKAEKDTMKGKMKAHKDAAKANPEAPAPLLLPRHKFSQSHQ